MSRDRASYGRKSDPGREVTSFPEDRLPPQNVEVERAVLGAVLLDNDALHEVVPILKVEDFYRDSHQIIYRTIRDLYDLGKPVDLLIVSEELRRKGEFDKIGGIEALGEIATSVPHAANAVYHAKIVHGKAVFRELIEVGNLILREGYSNTNTPEEFRELVERKFFEACNRSDTGETVDLATYVPEIIESIRVRKAGGLKGMPTGFYELDVLINGMGASQLLVIAGRPSMGKTTFALNIAAHAALKLNVAALIISMEMSGRELTEKIVLTAEGIDAARAQAGMLGPAEMARLDSAKLPSGLMFTTEKTSQSMRRIEATARRETLDKKVGVVVVDYLQLIESDRNNGRESRQEAIAKISRRLKQLARELDVPVIALSQLNRAVENREDRRPRMADLRESGAIEQDADVVMLIHRPEYYNANDQPGVTELIVAKNRNGATGTVKLTFLKNLVKFSNHAPGSDAPPDEGRPF